MALRLFDPPGAPEQAPQAPALEVTAPAETAKTEPVAEVVSVTEQTNQTTEVVDDTPAPAEQITEAQSTPLAGLTDEETSKLAAEDEYSRELQLAQQRHSECAITVEECKAELKSAKEDEKTALKTLMSIKLRGPNYAKFLKKPEAPATTTTADQPAGTDTVMIFGQEIQTTLAPAPAQDENAWRAYPTSWVIGNIEGMGKKKAKALIELYPTLGHLEDLRGEASRQHMHDFSKVLPKGFGRSIAERLEEAMFEAMKQIRNGEVAGDFAVTQPEQSMSIAIEITPPVELQLPKVELQAVEKLPGVVPAQEPKPGKLIPINERLDAIAKEKDHTCRAHQDAWQDGYETGLDELPIEKCAWESQAEVDDFIRGFLTAESDI